MRFTTLAVAFLFFSAVFASPIYPPRGANAGVLRKRSHVIGKPTMKTHCKRANPSQIISALQHMDKTPLASGTYGSVHHLGVKVDGQDAVVKVIKGSKMSKAKIEEEVRNLIQVHQYLGWAYKASSNTYYIIMPHMGEQLEKTGMKPGSPIVKELIDEALARYKKDFHMIHGDPDAQGGNPSGNIVYKSKGHGQWQAELIDWGFAGPDPHVNVQFAPVGAPVPITAEDCILSPPASPKPGSDDGWEFRRRNVIPRWREY